MAKPNTPILLSVLVGIEKYPKNGILTELNPNDLWIIQKKKK